MIDLNSRSALADRINWHIDHAIDVMPEEKRTYLGCSSLGGLCERAVQYDYVAQNVSATQVSAATDAMSVNLSRVRVKSAVGSAHGWDSSNCPPANVQNGGTEALASTRNDVAAEIVNVGCDRGGTQNGDTEVLVHGLPKTGAKEALANRVENEGTETLASSSHFSARVRRIFARGHDAEDRITVWLQRAGFLLETRDPMTGEQFEVQFHANRCRGHVDGILTLWRGIGPSPIPMPALWECKCLGHKYFMAAKRDHIRKSHPKYYSQMQLYMHGLHLERGIITCMDADSCEFYHELVEYDQAHAELMLARAKRIIEACDHGELLPRCETSPQRCKMCRWRELCWR